MWFKNLRIFRLSPTWSCTVYTLEAALEKQAFQPSGSRDMQSLGWIAPREDSGLVYALDGQYLLSLRADKKLLPTTVINQVAKARAQDMEEQQGFKPGRKQMKEITELVTDELLPTAFSDSRHTPVRHDTHNHWVVKHTHPA